MRSYFQRATGRIIGRGGENIRLISRASNAKINVDSLSSGGNKGKLRIHHFKKAYTFCLTQSELSLYKCMAQV